MRNMKRFIALVMSLALVMTSSFDAAAANTSYRNETPVRETLDGNKKVDNENDNILSSEENEDANTAIDAGLDLHEADKDETLNGSSIVKEDKEISVDLKNGQTKELEKFNDVDPDTKVRVIIVMEGNSIIENNSKAKPGFTSSLRTMGLHWKQNNIASRIEREVLEDESLDIRYHYTWLTNGIATSVAYGDIEAIEDVRGVESVIVEPVYEIDPQTVSDSEMIGRDDTWAAGYTGVGTRIAVIDTGLDYDHPSFAADPKTNEMSATQQDVEDALDTLHATKLYANNVSKDLTMDNVWYSTKIPFGFNYVDESLIIDHDHDTKGDHGTHVAGIAAANYVGEGKAVGTAPDAQLYIMKVFGAQGGAYADDILAALEDALLLEADVINMSLGSPAGFTSESEELDEIYGRVSETNTILSVAAGNSDNSAAGNTWGTDKSLTSNPDNGIMSSPGTYVNATTVASVENTNIYGYYIQVGANRFIYDTGSNNSGASLSTLAGEPVHFVMVDNYGQTLEDFENANVSGKVAIVQRGISNFTEKHKLAEEAGAIACIIYNNVDGTFGMDMNGDTATIPCVSVSMGAGECLKAAFNAGNDTFTISDTEAAVPSETGYRMSDFSSWGVSPDLTLEPDITAPGGNIYSTLNNGQYGLMSGTSMAAPNLAGCAALVMEYLREVEPNLTDAQMHTRVNALLMSTAVPIMYDDELPYSPRNQGAGLANAYNSIKTPAYLSVDGCDMPKAELGDDPEKTGTYSYVFTVTNTSDQVLNYTLHTNVMSENVNFVDELGESFLSMTPKALDAEISMEAVEEDAKQYVYDFNHDGKVNTADARWLYCRLLENTPLSVEETMNYDINKDETANTDDVQTMLDILVGIEHDGIDLYAQVLSVKPNSQAHVAVTIQLSQESKDYMDQNFENGIYVEGFTTLSAMNEGGIDLSLPYLAFYGDWTKAPVIDSGFYWEGEEINYSQYANVLFADYGKDFTLLGMNPYLADAEFDPSRISISPNGDGYFDGVPAMYISLLRNAKSLSFGYEDAQTNEVLFEDVANYARKTYFVPQYGQMIPYVYPESEYTELYDFTDKDGNVLENNTKINLVIKGEVDYDKHESNNVFDTWKVGITIDTEAPVITSDEAVITIDPETGKQYIDVTFKDNVGVAAMNFLNVRGTSILAQYPVEQVASNEEVTMRFDITGFGSDFTMVPGDYAGNESVYTVHTENNDPIVDESLLYGYRVYDEVVQNDSLYGWLGIDTTTAETKVMSSEPYADYSLDAAEYVGGYILGVDANHTLVWIKPGYWDDRKTIADLGVTITDLAFDPTTHELYGIDSTNSAIVKINIFDGTVTTVGSTFGIHAISFDNDGTFYGVNFLGELKTIDKATGQWNSEVLCSTKMYPSYTQSMTFDAENEMLYWVYYGSMSNAGTLYSIDINNGYELNEVGVVAGNAEMTGLVFMNDRGYTLPESDVESIEMSKSEMIMLVGDNKALDVYVNPWYAPLSKLTWSSDNEDVAVVDYFGNVLAKSVGSAVITAETEDGAYRAQCTINVMNPDAHLRGYALTGNTLFNQWISFDADDLRGTEVETTPTSLVLSAGEYYDGYLYGYSVTSAFYRMNAETLEKEQLSENRDGVTVMDMAFDYSSGYMYALTQDFAGVNLSRVDLLSGDYEVVGSAMDRFYSSPCALAISTDGEIYIMAQNGILYTYDLETNTMVQVGITGFTGSQFLQSMTYDHNSEGIYWAMLSSSGAAELVYVDPNTAQSLALGTIDGGAEVTVLHTVPQTEIEIPYQPVESVELTKTNMTLIAGGSSAIPTKIKPFNATNKNVEWTVENPEVVEISNGVLHALQAGDTIATGVLNDNGKTYTLELNVHVAASAGAIRGYVLSDVLDGSGQFWSEIYDYDLSSGKGLVDASAYAVFAGEYYDGKVYAYGQNSETLENQFMILEEGTYESTFIPGNFPDIQDMAFDYSQGAMYGIGLPFHTNGDSILYGIDITNGKTYPIASLHVSMKALACSTDGHLYGIDSMGTLYEINKVDGSLREIGNTGFEADRYQSMAFDHNTGNLYWAQLYQDPFEWTIKSGLKLVDPETAEVVNLGLLGEAGAQFTSMYIIPNEDVKAQVPEITGMVINTSKEMLKKGDTLQLSAAPLPVSVSNTAPIVYSSSDESIATVDQNGLVTAVGYGTVSIIASYENHKVECSVNVLDPEKKLYAFNEHGWEESPILEPEIMDSVQLPETAPNVKRAAYSEGNYYVLDTEDTLWTMSEDQSTITEVGNIHEQLVYDTEKYLDATIVDMTINAFTGKMYALVELNDGMYLDYSIYEVDMNNGSSTYCMTADYTIVNRAIAFTFVSETKAFLYDGYNDTVDSVDLANGTSKEECWAQNIIICGDNAGMTYSKELDMIFFASNGLYTNDVTLYFIDPDSGAVKEYAVTQFDTNLKALVVKQ